MPKAYKITKENLNKFLDGASKRFDLWAPVSNNDKVSFKPVENAVEIDLNFIRTTQSVKKVFHPSSNIIFEYTAKEGFTSKEDTPVKDIMVFGVHPCDLKGLLLLDKVFADTEIENAYLKRRKNAAIIALTCNDCDEYCFCSCMGSGPDAKEGFDLLFTDLGDSFMVETGTGRGEKLLEGIDKEDAADAELSKKKEKIDSIIKKTSQKECVAHPPKMREALIKNSEHPYWKEESDKCLSCASCTNVCPTCFCYSIKDNLDWDGRTTRREAYWDSCQNKEFAGVAHGENFRPERIQRLKQFVNHKLNYWHDQYNEAGCTGRGRCIEICPVDISLLDIIEKISK
ncbi:MAG: 4Fe-4S dicluster domain-containing protein [Armatimonadota bacterium]